MAKLVLADVGSLQSEPSALQTMAENNQKIETALENTLSRDGTSPNQMGTTLDLNGNRLINLAAPQSGTDAARLIDLSESLQLTGAVVPPLISDYVLSSSNGALVWRNPSSIPGLGDMKGANNLSELTNVPTARTNLGLGSAALEATGTSGTVLGRLDANLTFSGSNTLTGTTLFSGAVTFGGTVNHRVTATPTTLTSDSIGFRVPPSNIRDADYTLVLLDAATGLVHTSASTHTWTVPPESSVAYPGNTQILLINTGAGAVTIARGAGVSLRIAGTSVDKNMSLAQHGMATLVRAAANTWYIVGPGVT